MSLRDDFLSSYVAYSNQPPLVAAAVSWGLLLLSQIACFYVVCNALRRERLRSRPRIGHVPLMMTMLASCACSCVAVCVLYGSVYLTPRGSEIPTATPSPTESSASAFQRMAAEGLFAAYALLQMLAFVGFAASKMVTLLLLFTITVGLDWDQLFLLRAHTLLKRMIVTLSLLLMLCASAFVFFHVKSVATRVGIDRGSTNNSSLLQLRDDYRHACMSEGTLLLSQCVFLFLILLGLSAAILKVKPVTRDGPSTMAQPLLGMTDTWLFNSQFGRRIAACVLALVFLLVGRSVLSLMLGIGVLTMKETCDGGGDVLNCQSVTTLFTLWFFKAPWPQPLTLGLSETVGAFLSLAIIYDGRSDGTLSTTADSERNASISLTDDG